jgi:GT2 family glycosyltransferase
VVSDIARPGASPQVTGEATATVPPVVAVVIAHDPGPWFTETLESLRDQTYPDLAVLVIDTASTEDLTARVGEVLPEAHVHRLETDPGFTGAANLALGLVEGAAFFALCHDDIALEPDTIRSLVEEAFRSNAGIIGPKLVEWDDPTRLLQVGMSADKTGALAPVCERHELDQEQHDAVRDVFVVPGGCTVVRVDLFTALGGFDPQVVGLGDDLDLCWRAHTAGARVLIAPSARVRHLEAYGLRSGADHRRRQLARHRLRTSLVAYGFWHRVRVLPQAFLLALGEAFYAMLAGHPDQARDVLGAWPWNWRRLRQIRARRKALAATRQVGDGEVRDLQVRGSARITAFFRGQIGRRDDRVTSAARSSRDVAAAFRQGTRQFTGTLAIVLMVLLVIGSRGLLFGRLPVIGEMARFPASPRPLAEAWWSGWRRSGLGAGAAQPTGFAILAVLGYLFFGAMGLLRSVLILGAIPMGAMGAWRLAKPIGSARASVTAFAVYLAIPVPYNALARGSWSGLLLYAISPWLLLSLGRATGAAPFGPKGAIPITPPPPGSTAPAVVSPPAPLRRVAGLILGLGLALALVAAVTPFVLVVTLVLAAAIAVGSILCFRVSGTMRLFAVAFGAVGVAVLLHLPWSFDLLTAHSPWEAVSGLGSTTGGPLTLGRILRFQSGPWGAPPLGWAFLLAGALPVIIGRSWRLEWAVRSWVIVLVGWATLWASQEGKLPVGLPAAEVVLAPVAAALALTAALGLAAFETDLRAYRFGWRQVLSVLAAIGVLLGAVPLGSGLIEGRWRMPAHDFRASLDDLLTTRGRAPYRVVWVGDPELLPAAGWRYDDQAAYTSTDRGVPTVLDRFGGPPPGATHLLADALHLAQAHKTSRLGRLLAPMGVRYLVVQSRLAPGSTSVTGQRRPPKALTDVLAQQLDLAQVPVTNGLLVYRNTAWVPSRAVLPPRSGDATSYTDAAAEDLEGARPALTVDKGDAGATGRVPATGDLLVANTADRGWRLRVGGIVAARSSTYGWANQFDATRTGPATLSYQTPVSRRAATAGQLALWIVVFVVWRRVRSRERQALTPAQREVVG